MGSVPNIKEEEQTFEIATKTQVLAEDPAGDISTEQILAINANSLEQFGDNPLTAEFMEQEE